MAQFTKGRYHARLYAFCWTILETRQPDFNADKLKKQSPVLTIIQALTYATEVEKQVISQLTDLLKTKPDIEDERDSMLGALEGKMVIYDNLDSHLLLKDKEISPSSKTGSSGSSLSTSDSSSPNTKLIVWGCIAALILGLIIYNAPMMREKRAYKAVTSANTTFEERDAVDKYLADFPRGKHIEEVSYRNIKFHMNDATYIIRFLQKYPNSEYVDEVKQIYDDYSYRVILQKGNRLTDIMSYLTKFPNGTYTNEVNRLCDSIWDSEIAKYHVKVNKKKSSKAIKYLDAMLEYMKTKRVNMLVFSTQSKYKLKDYSEYSQVIRDDIELFGAHKNLPVAGNVLSLKDNFTQGDQSALNNILSEGLQESFDSIFTPGFIQVTDNETGYIGKENILLPRAVFNYEITSQEEDIFGTKYPHLWVYSENLIPKKYLIGISIFFRVKFSIPDSDIIYEFSGKGTPEKDISGIRDISDGYRQMTIMSFARFSNNLYAKFGLKEVY